MNFRSIAQLSDQLVAWSKTLPQDIDLVVGLPRSGLLAANILALYRNVPVADLDGFLAGRTMGAGTTRSNPLNDRPLAHVGADQVERELLIGAGVRGASPLGAPRGIRAGAAVRPAAAEEFLQQARTVLVLDDSIWSGETLRAARRRIEAARLPHRVRYGAVYVTPETVDLPDHYCEVLHHPRCFEWNVLHHHALRGACLDMDGLLCVDPTADPQGSDERYRRLLRAARPLHLPGSFIGDIVTSRSERYRAETEQWLEAHGIEYGALTMVDGEPTPLGFASSTAYKARAYRDSGARFFIESDLGQAVEIANLSKRDVLCVDTMQMIQPGSMPFARPGLALVDDVAPGLPRRIVRRAVPRSIRRVAVRLRRR